MVTLLLIEAIVVKLCSIVLASICTVPLDIKVEFVSLKLVPVISSVWLDSTKELSLNIVWASIASVPSDWTKLSFIERFLIDKCIASLLLMTELLLLVVSEFMLRLFAPT